MPWHPVWNTARTKAFLGGPGFVVVGSIEETKDGWYAEVISKRGPDGEKLTRETTRQTRDQIERYLERAMVADAEVLDKEE